MASATLVGISQMDWLQNLDLLSFTAALLPGFVAAWVFYGLTPQPKGDNFERTVQAFVYLAFIRLFLVPTEWALTSVKPPELIIGPWTENVEFGWSMFYAILLGLVFSTLANNDRLHELLRGRGLTKKTSFPTEWSSVFNRDDRIVVLHLKDDQRIMGVNIEFPDDPNSGHFVLGNAKWLCDDGNNDIDLVVVKHTLINVVDVKYVHTMKDTHELDDCWPLHAITPDAPTPTVSELKEDEQIWPTDHQIQMTPNGDATKDPNVL